jgi:hypothetical protein
MALEDYLRGLGIMSSKLALPNGLSGAVNANIAAPKNAVSAISSHSSFVGVDHGRPDWVDNQYNPDGTMQQGAVFASKDQHPGFRWELLMGRLRVNAPYEIGLGFLATALCGDNVVVFLVVRGTPVTLEDPVAMFPSDALINQLKAISK